MILENYDIDAAGTRLEQLSTARIETGFLTNPIASFAQELDWPREVTSTQTGTKQTQIWCLSTTDSSGEPEEVVFTVQGIISQCELPPATKPYGTKTSARNVRQRVLLTGYDTPTFTRAVEGLNRVNTFLRSNIREDTIPEAHTTDDGYIALDISNRYFTSKRFAGNQTHIPLAPTIDPKGHLDRLRGDNFVHVAENVVEYFERTVNHAGEQKFTRVPPSRLRVGHIVEIQFTVTMVETQRKHDAKYSSDGYKTRLVLRGITLLDSKSTEDCQAQATRPVAQFANLKRKVGHEAEETLEARERFKRMAIDRPGEGEARM